MLATGERPRELHWYHAGPMLFGDWGTSRLYVLGLAFAFTQHASFWFIAAMCVLMTGVGISYVSVCKLFPDGGGVYSAAKQRSQLLAVVGVLLLCADYVVTASLSCLDAFHYLGVKDVRYLGLPVDALGAAATILLIGWLNYYGPKKSGTLAMIVALATIALTLVIGVVCAFTIRPSAVRLDSPLTGGIWNSWVGFTEIVLALSGVEAVANMTGIMVQPVEKTARRTILPVLLEIVLLNLILAAAMNALPESILAERTPDGKFAHTGDMLRVIAAYYVHPTFAAISAVVFAALLLSAVNTALGALVSVQFMLSRDKELPTVLAGLNRAGVPLVPLVISSIVPAVVLLVFPNVEQLADLYAVGVVGAIAINLGSISTNSGLALPRRDRALMLVLTAVLIAIELTIGLVKPHARSFALLVLVIGLAGRLATVVSNKAARVPKSTRVNYLVLATLSVVVTMGLAIIGASPRVLFRVAVPGLGRSGMNLGDLAFWLMAGVTCVIGYASYGTQVYRQAVLDSEAAAHAALVAAAPATRPKMLLPGAYQAKFRIMVPTQGNPRLIDFAMQECKTRQAELQILFIRLLAVTPMGPTAFPTMAEDVEAQALFDRVRAQAKEAGVPLRLLYGVASDIPDAILDMAVTHGADLLLMGVTRRGALWKVMKGDIIQAVAEQLPEQVGLLIHA
jgi:amino acid transporter/nucleotide-binding universal stress UspA family protein